MPSSPQVELTNGLFIIGIAHVSGSAALGFPFISVAVAPPSPLSQSENKPSYDSAGRLAQSDHVVLDIYTVNHKNVTFYF